MSPQKFVNAVHENNPQIVGLSALLTTTMLAMMTVIDALIRADLRDRVKVLIGGAPVTEDFAKRIGADGYAPDAGSSTRKAREWMAAT